MKLTLFVLSVCILSIATHSDGQVKDRLKSLEETKTVQPTHAGAYLGIAVEPLHPAFGMHLPKSLVDGQGIMIANVMKGSPAEKAGLRMHDILAAYDDQKLFAGDQLVKLVRADKPGRSVKLQIVREGQLETVTVVLSEEPAHIADQEHGHRDLWERQFPWLKQLTPLRPNWQKPFGKRNDNWKRFDSLTLKKLDGDRFRAEIAYFDNAGKTQHHTFEGTREEIRKQIEDEKDMPTDERNQLLRGLDVEQNLVSDSFEGFGHFHWPNPFDDF